MGAFMTSPRFRIAGLLAVAADPTALQAESHAELATPGSPFVDLLITWASARGTASSRGATVRRRRA